MNVRELVGSLLVLIVCTLGWSAWVEAGRISAINGPVSATATVAPTPTVFPSPNLIMLWGVDGEDPRVSQCTAEGSTIDCPAHATNGSCVTFKEGAGAGIETIKLCMPDVGLPAGAYGVTNRVDLWSAIKTCTAGANRGAPCTVDSECPASVCDTTGDAMVTLDRASSPPKLKVRGPTIDQFSYTFFDTTVALSEGLDIPSIWINQARAIHITEVCCEYDAGTAPTIQIQRDDGSVADILAADLTCHTQPVPGSSTGCTATFSGSENAIIVGYKIGHLTKTTDTAKRLTVSVQYTVD